MHKDYLIHTLEKLYSEIDNKDMFFPLVLANTIICYKLTFYDASYWMEFSHWVIDWGIDFKNFEDIEIFFHWFVKHNLQFKFVYNETLQRLHSFSIFFEDFYMKQKYYYKYPQKLEKDMNIFTDIVPDADLILLSQEVVHIAGKIRFSN